MAPPWFFSSLLEAYHSFAVDPLSPLSFPPVPDVRLVNDHGPLRVQIKPSNGDLRFRILGQVNDKSKVDENMNLTPDEQVCLLLRINIQKDVSSLPFQLTNETIGRFRSKLGIFASGSHPMFKDIAKANAMQNQPYTFHHIERKLTAYSGGSSRGSYLFFC